MIEDIGEIDLAVFRQATDVAEFDKMPVSFKLKMKGGVRFSFVVDQTGPPTRANDHSLVLDGQAVEDDFAEQGRSDDVKSKPDHTRVVFPFNNKLAGRSDLGVAGNLITCPLAKLDEQFIHRRQVFSANCR